MATIASHKPGVTYNGLHATPSPTADQVIADLAATRRHFEHARTYYPQYRGGAIDVGKIAKDAGVILLLGLYLFDKPEWTEGNYQDFVKPAAGRGNVEGLLVGNEDPQMVDNGMITKYLGQAKRDFPQLPVGTSQQSGFWLADTRAQQLAPLVDFIGVNIYPAWDWHHADGSNQPIGITPEAGFNSFRDTFGQVRSAYPGRQVVVTETGWPTTFGRAAAQQFPVGIANAREYLRRVTEWAQAEQIVLYVHNMFDDQSAADESSPFNYHFGLIDNAGTPKGVLF